MNEPSACHVHQSDFFFFTVFMDGRMVGTAAFNSTQLMPQLAGSKVKTSCLT